MRYRIGSFNLCNLGFSALGKENPRNLSKIAEIIKKEHFDVVALQEVLSEGKAFTEKRTIERSILKELGSEWEFAWANSESLLNDSRNEGYAFLWNKRRLGLPIIMTDKGKRTFNPRICRINKRNMIRKPYYARFTPATSLLHGPLFEIRLICIHTYYGKDTNDDRIIRQNEFDVLCKDVYPQIADRRYGEYGNGMPSYTFLLGDYNAILFRRWKEKARNKRNLEIRKHGKGYIRKPAVLPVNENDEIIYSYKGERRVIKTVQDEPTTLMKTQNANDGDNEYDGRGYANDYDHFSFEESKLRGIVIKYGRIDAVRKYYNDDFEKYLKAVSDHIPIVMELEPNPRAISFTSFEIPEI